MSDNTLQEFTDDLLKSKILHCIHCENVLIFPIWLVEGIGNVCSECFESTYVNGIQKTIQNSSLECVMKELKILCKYHDKGCNKRLIYKHLRQHEGLCHFRSKKCPLNECLWEGNCDDFLNHFKEDHSQHIITCEENLFTLAVMYDDDFMKLIHLRNDILILHISVNKASNSLSYIICKINDLSNECDYTVKHKAENNDEKYIKTKSKIRSSDEIYKDLDNSSATKIGLDVLKDCEIIVNTFKLKDGSHQKERDIEEKFMHFFECPVCKTFMKPPIYQCQSGHSVCNLCRPRLEKCPSCRAPFGSTRNYSLEGLTSGVHYPCMYHDFGCEETAAFSEITNHENSCTYKPYKCPISSCSLTGKYQSIMNHLVEFHMDRLITTDRDGYTESFRLDQSIYGQTVDRRCLIAFEKIFRVTFRRSGEYCFWAVEAIANNDDKTYTYEVSIIDMRKPEKKVIRTDYCLDEMTDDELFKKCIMFPNTILGSYSSNGLVTFNLTVKK